MPELKIKTQEGLLEGASHIARAIEVPVHGGNAVHKRLYFETYRPELAAPDYESDQATFEVGHTIGALARDRYSHGTLIEEGENWADAEHVTRTTLRNPAVPAIFEAALSFDGVRIRADVLSRTLDRRFDLIEVKSTLRVKPGGEIAAAEDSDNSPASAQLSTRPEFRDERRSMADASFAHRPSVAIRDPG